MTKIPWCDETWNVTSGCSKVSPGCAHCYAERFAKRLKGMGLDQYQDVVDKKGWTGKVIPNNEALYKPLEWVNGRTVFVDSMSDLFALPPTKTNIFFLYEVFNVMRHGYKHRYMILTKRPKEGQTLMKEIGELHKEKHRYSPWPLPHVWMGVSVENQKATARIADILEIDAARYFISAEPLLEEIDVRPWISRLSMVIAGCESGPGRRKVDEDVFRNLRDQCVEADVSFFLKQMEVNGKIVSLPELDGKVWNQNPA